jgi:thiol-disulfide isomerase/thioredoxin
MPSLDGVIEWLNGKIEMRDIDRSPVLVYFWAASCPACLANMPNVQRWRDEYASRGLRFLAVHLPRSPKDRDLDRVTRAIGRHGITDPCAIDNDQLLASRFETGEVWPYYFFFDDAGKLRNRAAGGMGLRLLENSLNRCLSQQGSINR